MTVNQKLMAFLIARLRDRSVDVRLRTIRELAELGEPGALEALRNVYLNDHDEDVRKAAQEAGRVIFLKQKANEKGGA